MSRNVRVFVPSLSAGECKLDADAAHYLKDVHRLQNGDSFTAFDPVARLEADAVLLEAEPKRARCRIAEPRAARNVSTLGVTLIQSLGKGDKVEQVLRAATALGVTALAIVETERSVVRIGERAAGKHDRWQAILIDAARQCGRGDLPELRGPLALDDELRSERDDRGLMLCLDPDAKLGFAEALDRAAADAPITLLIGPEGGLTASELEKARTAGFLGVRFGTFTLRTEIAGLAVLGALVARRTS